MEVDGVAEAIPAAEAARGALDPLHLRVDRLAGGVGDPAPVAWTTRRRGRSHRREDGRARHDHRRQSVGLRRPRRPHPVRVHPEAHARWADGLAGWRECSAASAATCMPTPTAATTSCTSPTARSKSHAGRTRGASSSTPEPRIRSSPGRRSSGSARSTPSSATSRRPRRHRAASRRPTRCSRHDVSAASHSSRRSAPGSNGPRRRSCRVERWPNPFATASTFHLGGLDLYPAGASATHTTS